MELIDRLLAARAARRQTAPPTPDGAATRDAEADRGVLADALMSVLGYFHINGFQLPAEVWPRLERWARKRDGRTSDPEKELSAAMPVFDFLEGPPECDDAIEGRR